MKKLRVFSILLTFLVALSMVLTGCDNGTIGSDSTGIGGSANPFLGTWWGTHFTDQFFNFRADLTLTYGGSLNIFHGTYTFSGNKATLMDRGVTYPIEIGSDGSFIYLGQRFIRR